MCKFESRSYENKKKNEAYPGLKGNLKNSIAEEKKNKNRKERKDLKLRTWFNVA